MVSMEATMSHILVITFEDQIQAPNVLRSLKNLEAQGMLELKDAAVIVKSEEGKVEVKNMVESGVKIGAVSGGALGLLIGGLLFPIAGLALGIAGGALIGKTFQTGVDKGFIKEVKEGLPPGGSAILFIVGSEHVGVLIAALEPYNGTIYQSSFDSEAEASLRKALR
jgi:uncharacterized membrane protein